MTEVQTFIFDKRYWSRKQAEEWLRSKGRATEVDEKKDTLRYRQINPDRFVRGSFRTYDVPDEQGIQVVVGKIRSRK